MDVLSAGILVADLFAQPIDCLPQAGELKTTGGFQTGAGGCAANTALCLRRLGRSVGVAGKVGDDLLGSYVVEELSRQGVSVAHVVRTADLPTSATVIINVIGENRRYLHAIGANAGFRRADVPNSALDGVRILYIGGYLAMPAFASGDLRELFIEARRRRIITVLDVVIPAGSAGVADRLVPVLEYTGYFLPNADEAAALTGCADRSAQADVLSSLAPACTHVITRGSEGLLARRGSVVIEVPAYRMDSVDESGAGDAFAAGLIAGLLEGWELERTLRFGAAVGASCTRALGCTAGVFTFDEAAKFLEQQERSSVRGSA